MFGINNGNAQQMHNVFPHTFVAMQHLVMAMEDCIKNSGKKSWFGNDKGVDAVMKFKYQLSRTIVAMTLDGLIDETGSNEVVAVAIMGQIAEFAKAFPTWAMAYQFAMDFFGNEAVSLAVIAKARGTQ